MSALDFLRDNFEFGDGLESWMKYGLIISNFVMILFILVLKKLKGNRTTPENEQKNILFVIAHPDDESMFFLPTIQEMKAQNYKLHLLSFSSGDFDGLGKIREKELEKCCRFLGFDKCDIINDSEIKDGMKNVWPTEKMVGILKDYCEKNNIQGIFTFDESGVSGHPNHIDVYRSVKLLKQKNYDSIKSMKYFQLQTVNILRKYIGVMDIIFCLFSEHTFVNYNPLKAWQSMSLHASQFVYYRKLFVIFSRYAYINTLQPIE